VCCNISLIECYGTSVRSEMAYTIMDNDKGKDVVSHEPEGYIKS
jgi:hypothetical protein